MFKRINWRYALGEIAIVIIGITIAFSLNQWAASAKEAQLRQQYLTGMLADLDSEIAGLQANIDDFEAKLGLISGVMPHLYGQREGRDTIVQEVFKLAEIVRYNPYDITYKTLINSGDLGLFPDFGLRKQLEEHYSRQEIIRQDYSRQNNINERYFGDFMIHNIDYNALRDGDYSFLDDPLLRNIVQSLYGTYGIAMESAGEGITRCRELQASLQVDQ